MKEFIYTAYTRNQLDEDVRIYNDDDSFAIVRVIKINENLPNESLLIREFNSYFPEVKEVAFIANLFVNKEDRNKGIGSALLNKITEDFSKDHVILTTVGASDTEYPEEIPDTECAKIAEDLVPFYEKNGFANVNNILGNYYCMRSLMYNKSGKGKGYYKKLIKLSKEDGQSN